MKRRAGGIRYGWNVNSCGMPRRFPRQRVRDHIDHGRIEAMFDTQDAGSERGSIIVRHDRHGPLRDDAPLIITLVDVVHGGPRYAATGCEDGFVNARAVHAGAAECRQQRRMDVQHSSTERFDDGGWHESKVSGEGNEIYLPAVEFIQGVPSHVRCVAAAHWNVHSVDPGVACSCERTTIRSITHHECDADMRCVGESIDQSLQIRSAARCENGERNAHARPPP
jgi:hypothetical protein